MEEVGLACLGTCSKRCLKRLESCSKCHWLEMCLFFLIGWMKGEVGAGICRAPCPGKSWGETVRSGPSWWLGDGKEMRNRVTVTDSGLGRWCQFLDQGHDMFLAQYRLECCLSFCISTSPLWDTKFILHKTEKTTFLCARPVTSTWGGLHHIQDRGGKKKEKGEKEGQESGERTERKGKRYMWKDKAEMWKERKEERYVVGPSREEQ